MWDRIIKHLDDSHDLHSLSQAVPVCGEFLHETKVKWLFDQVVILFIHLVDIQSLLYGRRIQTNMLVNKLLLLIKGTAYCCDQ